MTIPHEPEWGDEDYSDDDPWCDCKDMAMNKWHVEYNNNTGPNDDCFYQWWEVTDGEHVFKSDSEDDAKWLCELLNARAA